MYLKDNSTLSNVLLNTPNAWRRSSIMNKSQTVYQELCIIIRRGNKYKLKNIKVSVVGFEPPTPIKNVIKLCGSLCRNENKEATRKLNWVHVYHN